MGRRLRARLAYALAAGAVFATVIVPGLAVEDRAYGLDPGIQVTATPTTDVVDGGAIQIAVRTAPGITATQIQARVCRDGVDYQPGDSLQVNPDFFGNGPNCPNTAVSTSGTSIVGGAISAANAASPEGDTFQFRAAVGTVVWNDGASDQTLTCDKDNPCSLVVEVRGGPTGALQWAPAVFELHYADSDPIGSCGGLSKGALTTAGSDALSDAWIRWTKASCNTQDSAGAWTSMSFGDEGDAVDRFAHGQLDVAYTGLGYDAEAGFVDTGDLPDGPRASVAVPIGLNAVVFGAANGWLDSATGRIRPFEDLSLSLDEIGSMLAGGIVGAQPYVNSMILRNPTLGLPSVFTVGSPVNVGGPSERGTTAFVATKHFATLRPDQWVVPDSAVFGADAGRPRGVSNSLALADPTFLQSVTLMTGRPGLAKELGRGVSDGGGIWILTDRTTAAAFGLSQVAIGTPDGSAFISPTSENLAAAVDGMHGDDDGILVPDPNSTAGYPLTYVEYALVPAEPLTDPVTGECRTDSQELLTKWLSYVVHDGQSALPPGLEPLTPELQAQAEAQLQKVGQTPGAPCPVPQVPGGPSPDPAGGGGAGSDVSSTAAPSSPTNAPSGRSATLTTGADAVEQANAALTVSNSDVPGFLGGSLPSVLAAVAALLGIGGLTAVAARQTSRRALPAGAAELSQLPPPPDDGGGV